MARVVEGEAIHLGESWTSGVVVLSWDDVRAGASDIHDGQNLVFTNLPTSSTAKTARSTALRFWKSAASTWPGLACSMASMSDCDVTSRLGRATVLDEYGATDPAEFFAVATECFFEKPRVLKKRHPELYEELKTFYRQDPARLLPVTAEPASGEIT